MKHAKMKSPKIEDVARLAQVSIMSVSRAMRGVEGVSEQKRDEIIQIARSIGYHPSNAAATLAASSSPLIGVSVPTIFGSVFAEIFNSMRSTFEHGGFQTIFDVNDYSEKSEEVWVERMISWRPAGIILTGVDHTTKTKRLIKATGIPTLEIWDYSKTPIDICVGIDHYKAGFLIGEYIAKLGYKNPAYIGVNTGKDKRSENRLNGIQDAFKKKSIEFCKIDSSSNDATFDSGQQATKQLMENTPKKPDVIFYLNDNMAFGGTMYCEKHGVKIPQDIGIVGCNDLNINTVLNRQITTTITPLTQMGTTSARNLVAKISGAKVQPSVALKVEIKKGQTTCQQK
ncbi:MAG: LacI family DNA-binding transcriptional regulator [Nitratireductor sp.]